MKKLYVNFKVILFHNEIEYSLLPCLYQHLEDQLILEFHHAYEPIFERDETLLNYKLFQTPRAVAVGYYPIECVSSTEMKSRMNYDLMVTDSYKYKIPKRCLYFLTSTPPISVTLLRISGCTVICFMILKDPVRHLTSSVSRRLDSTCS